MHGRVKKDVVEPTPEEKEKQREQVRTARSLFGKLLELRKDRVYNDQALDLTAKALQFHPEFPTLWGYRRELLTETGKEKPELLKLEMKLLEKALRKSQKVYSIWFHRRWVVDRLFKSADSADSADVRGLLDTELDLCQQLLAVDERNFHCWNHRMHVVDLMRAWLRDRAAPEAEGLNLKEMDFKLSTDLINKNFSNYSAWHLRTLQDAVPGPPVLDVQQELEWVQQGIYTEPNDQSVWLYHQWLTLDRGSSARITRCARLGDEVFLFFSRPVSAGTATLAQSGRALQGRLDPILPGPDLVQRCRPRAAGARARMASGWRWVPESDAKVESGPVEVSVELNGTTVSFVGSVDSTPSEDLPAERLSIWQTELERIEELLEIEPDCRWALLARLRLKAAGAAAGTDEALSSGLEDLKKMKVLDPLREQFYADTEAELTCQQHLRTASSAGGALDLGGLGLRQLSLGFVAQAFGLKELRLDGNLLSDLGPLLGLLSLEMLSAAKNRLRCDAAEVFALKRLKEVDLSGNSALRLRGLRISPPEALSKMDLSGLQLKEGEDVLALLLAADLRDSWTADTSGGRCLICRK